MAMCNIQIAQAAIIKKNRKIKMKHCGSTKNASAWKSYSPDVRELACLVHTPKLKRHKLHFNTLHYQSTPQHKNKWHCCILFLSFYCCICKVTKKK